MLLQAVQAGEGMRVGGARKAILPPELVGSTYICIHARLHALVICSECDLSVDLMHQSCL